MIRAIIVDDEKHAVATLAWKIEKFCPGVELVNQFTDSMEALEYIEENRPDILFLDIEMPRLNGFELLAELSQPLGFEVIFITAYDEFGIKAVKANAMDYLLKPVQNQELKAAIEKFNQKGESPSTSASKSSDTSSQGNQKIALATKESIEFVNASDIIMCVAESNYTMVYMAGDRKKLLSRTLKDVDQWISKHGFYRSHLSHLVNISHIKEYVRQDGGYLMMSNGMHAPVARNRKEDLLKLF